MSRDSPALGALGMLCELLASQEGAMRAKQDAATDAVGAFAPTGKWLEALRSHLAASESETLGTASGAMAVLISTCAALRAPVKHEVGSVVPVHLIDSAMHSKSFGDVPSLLKTAAMAAHACSLALAVVDSAATRFESASSSSTSSSSSQRPEASPSSDRHLSSSHLRAFADQSSAGLGSPNLRPSADEGDIDTPHAFHHDASTVSTRREFREARETLQGASQLCRTLASSLAGTLEHTLIRTSVECVRVALATARAECPGLDEAAFLADIAGRAPGIAERAETALRERRELHQAALHEVCDAAEQRVSQAVSRVSELAGPVGLARASLAALGPLSALPADLSRLPPRVVTSTGWSDGRDVAVSVDVAGAAQEGVTAALAAAGRAFDLSQAWPAVYATRWAMTRLSPAASVALLAAPALHLVRHPSHATTVATNIAQAVAASLRAPPLTSSLAVTALFLDVLAPQDLHPQVSAALVRAVASLLLALRPIFPPNSLTLDLHHPGTVIDQHSIEEAVRSVRDAVSPLGAFLGASHPSLQPCPTAADVLATAGMRLAGETAIPPVTPLVRVTVEGSSFRAHEVRVARIAADVPCLSLASLSARLLLAGQPTSALLAAGQTIYTPAAVSALLREGELAESVALARAASLPSSAVRSVLAESVSLGGELLERVLVFGWRAEEQGWLDEEFERLIVAHGPSPVGRNAAVGWWMLHERRGRAVRAAAVWRWASDALGVSDAGETPASLMERAPSMFPTEAHARAWIRCTELSDVGVSPTHDPRAHPDGPTHSEPSLPPAWDGMDVFVAPETPTKPPTFLHVPQTPPASLGRSRRTPTRDMTLQSGVTSRGSSYGVVTLRKSTLRIPMNPLTPSRMSVHTPLRSGVLSLDDLERTPFGQEHKAPDDDHHPSGRLSWAHTARTLTPARPVAAETVVGEITDAAELALRSVSHVPLAPATNAKPFGSPIPQRGLLPRPTIAMFGARTPGRPPLSGWGGFGTPALNRSRIVIDDDSDDESMGEHTPPMGGNVGLVRPSAAMFADD
jgi:hypothetical protein